MTVSHETAKGEIWCKWFRGEECFEQGFRPDMLTEAQSLEAPLPMLTG